MCGGVGETRDATNEIQQIADSVKSHVLTSKNLHPYKAISYKSQVVAGINYFIKVEIDGEYLHLRVFCPLGENPQHVLSRHQESHTRDSEICYF